MIRHSLSGEIFSTRKDRDAGNPFRFEGTAALEPVFSVSLFRKSRGTSPSFFLFPLPRFLRGLDHEGRARVSARRRMSS